MTIQPRQVPIRVLRILWILLVLFYEYGVFHVSVQSCKWPDHVLRPEISKIPVAAQPKHVLLVADPQIVDEHSYPRRGQMLSSLSRVVVDINLKKSWNVALRKSPDAVVFLGDMMDGGRRDMPSDAYASLTARFYDIFRTPPDLPVYFIPGNHDIGIGPTYRLKQSPHAYERYGKQFGATNQIVSIANHSLVLFDAPSYVREDSRRHGHKKTLGDWTPISGGSYEFAERFGKLQHEDPIIFFSHIPMYRPDGKNCGSLRERGTLRPGNGEGYQNTIDKDSSKRIMEIFKPVAIFSGDDHDYCEYVHHVDVGNGIPRPVTEITVKSISMTMGILRPGFQLLSLAPTELRDPSNPTFADEPCFLPDQLQIYLQRYLVLFVISLVLIAILNLDLNFGRLSRSAQPEHPIPKSEEIGHLDSDDETAPSASSYALPTPTTASFRDVPTTRSRGWFVSASDSRSTPTLSSLTRSLRSLWPVKSRNPSRRRRSWLGRCLRDVMAVAVPTLVLFFLLNWWTIVS